MARRGEAWVSVREAAETLGTSVDAIRKRIRRGSLTSEKAEDGRVYVWLDSDQDGGQTNPDVVRSEQGELVEELRDRIHYLERQVEEEREARRRADTLIARLMDRLPELEPPEVPPEAQPGPRDEARTAHEEPGKGPGPTRESEGLRSRFRRWFGGSQ